MCVCVCVCVCVCASVCACMCVCVCVTVKEYDDYVAVMGSLPFSVPNTTFSPQAEGEHWPFPVAKMPMT